jgi:type II secretory pathway predicted ATPase ExeA
MLSNSELDSASPLACLLLGQPRLRHNMKLAVLAASPPVIVETDGLTCATIANARAGDAS